ncbi:hypothetical protein BJ878DRAFT_476536 [Calycina marina]|uniref:BRCT domain-containing protein n=1 Tax=Calycina marina TaxID=1763456 RepID=A0A9P7ZAB1_9HELO|nr:hypothetical protein BJ878DRAFT_476536 [Calycina marina]
MAASSDLFAKLKVVILQSDEVTKEHATEVQKSVEDHGGKAKIIPIEDRINFGDGITHVITTKHKFAQYAEAEEDRMLPVVTPNWVTMSLMRNKLLPHRPYTPDGETKFFSNLIVSCADIPDGDKEAIIGAVVTLGGTESNAVTKLTTHLCALTMDHPKVQSIIKKEMSKIKIVLPHWFDDCLKLGKRIDETPYLLPDPEIFHKNPEDDVEFPKTAHIEGATSPEPEFQEPPKGWRRATIFKNKKVMVSKDLEIHKRTRQIIDALINGGGGTITNSVKEADILVCRYRAGEDYVYASRAGKSVGNLSWLYHLITHNEWKSPLRKLLHYPIPKEPLPGFENLRITLSNYGGDARLYLENLVVASGGEYTKNMKADNTHLITARNNSEKCDAAREWQVEMVNHIWIEESYAKCEAQKLTDLRYTHFPPRTNLGEVIGHVSFDENVLAKVYFPGGPLVETKTPNPKKRSVMHDMDSNSEDNVMNDFTDTEKPLKTKSTKSIKIVTKPKSRLSPGPLSTPASVRRISAGLENGTPSSTRSAKAAAISNLQALAPDLALYEKEKKRKGLIWGGERAANRLDKERSLERESSPAVSNDDDADEHPKPKRAKRATFPPAEIRLLITKYEEWLDAPTKEEAEKKKLRELGVLVVQDPAKCTHLAAPAMVRTKKFLCALATGPTIVNSEFIGYCIKQREVPDAKKFPLKDTAAERKWNLKLKDVLVRAKANKRSLLRNAPVYCTPELPMNDTYKEIVESNGGTFLVYRARGGATIKPTRPEEDDGPAEPVYLLSGTRPEERKMWPKFVEMAKAGNMLPRIVKADWLLDTAMSQQHLQWNDKYLSTTGAEYA